MNRAILFCFVATILVSCACASVLESNRDLEYAKARNVISAKNSKLTCDNNKHVRRGDVFGCKISVLDLDGNSLQATSSDFNVKIKQGSHEWTKTSGSSLAFTVTVSGSASLAQVFASVARNDKTQNIKNSPKSMTVYGIPTEKSVLSCNTAKAAPGTTLTCTIDLKDGAGKTTTGLGVDLSVFSSNNEQIVISPVSKDRTSYTFVYHVLETQYASFSLHARVRSSEKGIVNSPVSISVHGIRVDGYTVDSANTNFGSYIDTTWIDTADYNLGEAIVMGMGTEFVGLSYKAKLLIPSGTTKVKFQASADDRVRFWFNNKLISGWTSSFTSGSIAVTGGNAYSFQLDTAEYAGSASLTLKWSLNDGAFTSIPSDKFILTSTPVPRPSELKSGSLHVDGFSCDISGFYGTYLGTKTVSSLEYNWDTASVLGFGTDNIALSIVGWVKMPSGVSSVKFWTNSDDGLRVFLNNKQIISFWSLHFPTVKESSSYTVTGGELYPIRVDFYENGGGAIMQLKWCFDSCSSGYQTIPAANMFYGQIPVVGPSNTVSGIHVDGYTSDYSGSFGSFIGSTTVTQINKNPYSGVIEYFGTEAVGMVFKGYITIPADKTLVRFRVKSDDGARLTFGNNQVLNQWVAQFATDVDSTPIPVTPGANYPFQLDFFEGWGDATLVLSWAFDGQNNFVVVPASAFSRAESSTPATASGLNVDGFTLANIGGVFSQIISGKSQVVNSISYSWGDGNVLGFGTEYVGLSMTGLLTVPSGVSKVSFKLASDDGSTLFFNGKQLVADYYYLHGPENPKTVSTAITPGTYPVRVDWFEWFGGATLKLQWCFDACSGGYQDIAASYLSHYVETKQVLGFRDASQKVSKKSVKQH